MLPTKWDGKDILVMDQVSVKGPGYRSEDCRAGKEAGPALARVKKVVSKGLCSPDSETGVCALVAAMIHGC